MPVITRFDPWRSPLCTCPPKYSFSAYTGCPHACLYCYISSYIPHPFECRAKRDPVGRLIKELEKVNPEHHFSIANSSDPYPPLERKLELTKMALKEILTRGFRVQLITKSDLVLRDIDLIKRGNCSVSLTITTMREELARKIEPGAPSPRRRLRALRRLTSEDIPCAVRIDPLIPSLNDGEIEALVESAAEAGAYHVVSSTYKAKKDSFERLAAAFPGLRDRLYDLYWIKGERHGRSLLLPEKLRRRILRSVKELVEEEGMTFSTCREGIPEFNSGETCDGSHLIPYRLKPEVLSLKRRISG